jgi:hypothetical protein
VLDALGIVMGEDWLNGQGLLPSCEILQVEELVQVDGILCQFTESPCSASQLSQMLTLCVLGMSAVLLSCLGAAFQAAVRWLDFTWPIPGRTPPEFTGEDYC